jgi:hypothetical protein
MMTPWLHTALSALTASLTLTSAAVTYAQALKPPTAVTTPSSAAAPAAAAAAAAAPVSTAPPEPRGDVVACRSNPRFLQARREFSSRAFFSTSERFLKGLVLIENTTPQRTWQHPTWSQFGWLAGIHYDEKGNVYTVPAPRINVFDNKPEEQNRILKVDTMTGEMKVLTSLPAAAPKTEQNAYGALGIAYDCETRLLYVSSISGSTRNKEVGRIFAVDPDTGAVRFKREATDAIGLHLFKINGEKRLYFGRAREPEIVSVAIDKNGAFVGEPRFEISLEGLGPRGDDHARRISFTPTNEMLVWGIEFNVNLVAPTEKQETLYRYRFDADAKRWVRQLDSPYQR